MGALSYSGQFGDKRIEKRRAALRQRLFGNSSQSIQRLSQTKAEQKAYYRFLHNKKVSEPKLIDELLNRCSSQVKGKVVLAIRDTPGINLTSHRNRLKDKTGLGNIPDRRLERLCITKQARHDYHVQRVEKVL